MSGFKEKNILTWQILDLNQNRDDDKVKTSRWKTKLAELIVLHQTNDWEKFQNDWPGRKMYEYYNNLISI